MHSQHINSIDSIIITVYHEYVNTFYRKKALDNLFDHVEGSTSTSYVAASDEYAFLFLYHALFACLSLRLL